MIWAYPHTMFISGSSLFLMPRTPASAKGFAAFLLLTSSSYAAVTVAGSFDTANAASVEIEQSITLSATSTANVIGLVFDEWVVSDGGTSVVDMNNLSYNINGASSVTSNTQLVDNYDFNISDLSPNDGYFYFDKIAVASGDSITFSNQIVSNTGTSTAMNTDLNGLSFNGNVFLIDENGDAISPLAAVPEPATAGLLLGGAALGLLYFRRRM